jgi:hypothetical protein
MDCHPSSLSPRPLFQSQAQHPSTPQIHPTESSTSQVLPGPKIVYANLMRFT